MMLMWLPAPPEALSKGELAAASRGCASAAFHTGCSFSDSCARDPGNAGGACSSGGRIPVELRDCVGMWLV